MQVNLEYVISATGSMGIFSNPVFSDHHPELKSLLLQSMDSLKKHVEGYCIHTKPRLSALYNAYTEEGMVKKIESLGNLGCHSIYADSGGLQIVTAGKSTTPEIKNKIYKAQSYSDFAMCFDEIPLEKTTIVQTVNERSNVGNKVFDQSRHYSSGVLTGQNIKEQIDAFRTLGAKTKVIMIIQGNNASDMVDYFNAIASQLSIEDYEYVGGMAVADTCIGNGVLESIEMLKGAKAITQICHPNVAKHLHILGVGSVARMRPILYLIKSGYLNTFERVSYDSSSHTSTFRFGLLKLDGGCKALGSTRTRKAEQHFVNVYDFFFDMLNPILTVDEFLDIILLDGQTQWSMANVKNNAVTHTDKNKMIVAFLSNALHTYYQIGNFIGCLDKVFEETNEKSAVGSLLRVKSDVEMNEWFRHSSKHVSSKRIVRKENHANLQDLFQ